jgi:hypothetical protein
MDGIWLSHQVFKKLITKVYWFISKCVGKCSGTLAKVRSMGNYLAVPSGVYKCDYQSVVVDYQKCGAGPFFGSWLDNV